MKAKAALRRVRWAQALVALCVLVVVAVLIGWWKEDWLKRRMYTLINVHALTLAQEQALKPKDSFKECTDCPEMIVVPAGSFVMGSDVYVRPEVTQPHPVEFSKPFAVSKFEQTFSEWQTCVAYGECSSHISDSDFGRGQHPVINVSWDESQRYVEWLSKMTGRTYRLLTEAEYEYATRAGTKTYYPWGDAVGVNNANCQGCGSQWDNRQTAPVGSFTANGFGLFDMVGNVWEWVEDCYHSGYEVETPQGKLTAPADGSAWMSDDCKQRVARGGSWLSYPGSIRSSNRIGFTSFRANFLGFRVARTLNAH
jgi:formylglycine-generating enzyme required for sulfatase activity